MSDRFSFILDAAVECFELARTLEDNIQNWNQTVDDVFNVVPPKWCGKEADKAHNKVELINEFIARTLTTQLDTAANNLCSWWEDQVDQYNKQQYEEAIDHYQHRLNAHLAWHEQGVGAIMSVVPGVDNPTSAAENIRPPRTVRDLNGRPSPPSYTVATRVFIHYVIEDSDTGGWPSCYGMYKYYPAYP